MNSHASRLGVAITAAATLLVVASWALSPLGRRSGTRLGSVASVDSEARRVAAAPFDSTAFVDQIWPDAIEAATVAAPASVSDPEPTLELLALHRTKSEGDVCAAVYSTELDAVILARVGDRLGASVVEVIDPRGIALREGDRVYRLELRGSSR